jgi:hypothetical protein
VALRWLFGNIDQEELMPVLSQHIMSRRGFCLCCMAASTVAASGGWAHHWGNADLLPDIKVNTDAMARTTQLVQQGFVKITE